MQPLVYVWTLRYVWMFEPLLIQMFEPLLNQMCLNVRMFEFKQAAPRRTLRWSVLWPPAPTPSSSPRRSRWFEFKYSAYLKFNCLKIQISVQWILTVSAVCLRMFGNLLLHTCLPNLNLSPLNVWNFEQAKHMSLSDVTRILVDMIIARAKQGEFECSNISKFECVSMNSII